MTVRCSLAQNMMELNHSLAQIRMKLTELVNMMNMKMSQPIQNLSYQHIANMSYLGCPSLQSKLFLAGRSFSWHGLILRERRLLQSVSWWCQLQDEYL